MFGLGFQELLVVGVVAILLFGKRLPEVAKQWGKSYREFRRGLSELQSHVNFNEIVDSAPSKPRPTKNYSDYDDADEPTAPRFQPPPSDDPGTRDPHSSAG
jgi:sec-independent protein translocase protein TatA